MRKIPKIGDKVYYQNKERKVVWIQKIEMELLLYLLERYETDEIYGEEIYNKYKEYITNYINNITLDIEVDNVIINTKLNTIETEEERKLRIREEQLNKLIE